MNPPAVHKLVGEQLPRITVAEPLEAESEIAFNGKPEDRGDEQLDQESGDIDNQ